MRKINWRTSLKKALFFQPHNDDCAIAVGGLIHRLKKAGWSIVYIYMTDGRNGSLTIPPEKLIQVRRVEAEAERRLLGIDGYYEFLLRDDTLSPTISEPLQRNAIQQTIVELIERHKPVFVAMPTPTDMHDDHKGTHDIVNAAVEQARVACMLMEYSVWLVPDFYEKHALGAEKVILINIDNEIEKKLEAIQCHKTQIERAAYDKAAKSLNAYYAHIFKADSKLNASHAEVVGLFRVSKAHLAKLIASVGPVLDVTMVVHGRAEYQVLGDSDFAS